MKIKLILRAAMLVLMVLGTSHGLRAHQVDTVEFEFQELEDVWRLHGEMDVAYMLPETRWVPDAGPLSRKALMKEKPEELARIRRETENTLRRYLKLTHAGKTLDWRIEFPDFAKQPFTLPEEYNDWALMTVRLVVDKQTQPGTFKLHWSEKEKATLIVLDELSNDGIPMPVEPGQSLALLKVSAPATKSPGDAASSEPEAEGDVLTERPESNIAMKWLKSGFLHVVPKGLDHMLFIVGLFLATIALRPMLWQSLLFTLAHSLTLGVCALGWLGGAQGWSWVEIFIALTIAYIGIENLFKIKVGKRRYITVFIFGLVHGMGFASVFVEQVQSVPDDKLLKPLLWFNLGVEVAQIAVILVMAILFAAIPKKRRKLAQTLGSLLVALAGLAWVVERIFFT
ncbi:MAG: HupE/UreJ family protein [Akkermansiaceae bacterium]|nr:HupE/UreJ family protein [Akkermansiaceae bacterium]